MKSNEEILELERTLQKLENLHASFDYLRITIASPQRIKSWAERQLPSFTSHDPPRSTRCLPRSGPRGSTLGAFR